MTKQERAGEVASRKITLHDIAAAAGVSTASASLALNDRAGVSTETRLRVREIARELGYLRFGRRAETTQPPTINVVIERLPVAPMSDPFNKPILLGIESAARRHGYRISMEFVTPEDHPDQASWRKGGAEGLLILGGGDLKPQWIQEAIDAGIPLVMVDNVIPGLDLPSVVPDNLSGAYTATKHLLELGHRRIGFIRGPSKYWTLSERLAGYLLALEQADVWPDPALIPPRVSHSEEKGHGEMHQLLDLPDRPTAVMAVSDKTAVGAYRAIQERGLRIPGDISLVGFDDIEIGRSLTPPLTTVHVPGEEMGRVSFERLQHLIDN